VWIKASTCAFTFSTPASANTTEVVAEGVAPRLASTSTTTLFTGANVSASHPRAVERRTPKSVAGHVPSALDEIAKPVVVAPLRAPRGRHEDVIARSLTPLNSSRTSRAVHRCERVRRSDDNSRRKVQNVRGDSSASSHVWPKAAALADQLGRPS
jgi:hypothetical protein